MEDVGILDDAIRKDVVPITSAFHKLVYEVYLKKYRDTGKKTTSIQDTSIETQVSERNVWKIIKKMES